jgi:hypothetical protein
LDESDLTPDEISLLNQFIPNWRSSLHDYDEKEE